MIRYRAGYKYQLAETYAVQIGVTPLATIEHPFFRLTVLGWLTIQAGYAWDGASGPAIDTKSFMRGSLVHDVCYQALSLGLLSRQNLSRLIDSQISGPEFPNSL